MKRLALQWPFERLRGPDSAVTSELPLTIRQAAHLRFETLVRRRGEAPPPFRLVLLCRCQGILDVNRLRDALQRITRRHAALRTVFRGLPFERAGTDITATVRQLVLPSAEFPLTEISTQPDSSLEDSVSAYLQRRLHGDLPYTQAPLASATVIRHQANDSVLLIILHHLIADGWSLGVLKRELIAFYGTGGDELADVSDLDERIVTMDAANDALDDSNDSVLYWQRQWRVYDTWQPCYDDFPGWIRRSSGASGLSAFESLDFDPETSAFIRIAARRLRVTLYELLYAAYGLALCDLLERSRIAVWVPFANRRGSGSVDAIAWLVNSHLQGVNVGDNPTGRELIDRVRRMLVESAAHQHISRHRLSCCDSTRPPYGFQLLLDHTVDAGVSRMDPTLSMTSMRVPGVRPEAHLTLQLEERRAGLSLNAFYPSHRFSSRGVKELLERLASVMVGLAANQGLYAFEY